MIEPGHARELLEDVGFLIVPGPPFVRGPAYLLIALRAAPTLAHFDPDLVQFWTSVGGRGMAATIERSTQAPARQEFSWGMIRIVDRLGISNEFVSFGGALEVDRLRGIKVLVFSSEAPILARGGHSQEWEFGSQQIHAYLGRLRAAADPRAALEKRIADLSPVARYAAFIWESIATIKAGERIADWRFPGRLELLAERRRLRQQSATDWAAGVELACELTGPALTADSTD